MESYFSKSNNLVLMEVLSFGGLGRTIHASVWSREVAATKPYRTAVCYMQGTEKIISSNEAYRNKKYKIMVDYSNNSGEMVRRPSKFKERTQMPVPTGTSEY